MNDLEQFKETFITEASELSEEMEDKLMNLDVESPNMEEINAIFRCAHSIKGGAGSFGFDRLVKFTHILEFLLDSLRNSQIQATEEIIDSLLRSVDILKKFIVAAQNNNEAEEGIEDELLEKLKALSESKSAGEAKSVEKPAEKTKEVASASNKLKIYKIKFVPFKELFESGNEPLYIIRELQRSCDSVVVSCDYSRVPQELPLGQAMNCYLSWEITAKTKEGISKIKEAFEFVEDECELEITEVGVEQQAKQGAEDEDGAWGLFEEYAAEVKAKREIADDSGAWGLFDDSAVVPVASGATSEAIVTPAPAKKPVTKVADQGVDKELAVSSIRVDIHKIDKMVNMVGELVITQAMIQQKLKDVPPQYLEKLLQGVSELSRHTRELQEAVMAVRMQPVKSVFSRMPRVVRDLSKKLGKNVRLEMRGENTEIDKTVIELLSDPLMHMIRNSVDHGVEKPEERLASGKPAEGVVYLSADSAGGRIIIEISDDGKGINRERVLSKAIEKGVVSADANLSPEEIDMLIFHAGFSTAEKVTDVSGRGVGMDVVRKNIKDLGGDIHMTNIPGKGSRFQISLPLTLAILDGMVIRIGGEKYIVAINNILETMQVKGEDILAVKNGDEVINVRGEFIPIVYLDKIFHIKSDGHKAKPLIVLVESGRSKIGIVVDELLGQQQVVIKNLEENSDPVEGVSGATILGDGNVSLILDIAQILKMKAKPKPDLKIVA